MASSVLHEIVQNAHDLAPSTRDKYLKNLDRWIEFAGNDPTQWTRYRARDFYAHLLTTMKPQSANQLMAGLSYAARWWATYENDPSKNFAKVQVKDSEDAKPQRALNQDEVVRLLSTCSNNTPIDVRDLALFTVGLETGMRRMSLISMRIESTLFVGDRRWPYPATFVELKGQDPNWIPLSDVCLVALRPWIAMLDNEGITTGPLFTPIKRKLRNVKSNMAPIASSISKSTIARIFADRGKAAGIVDLHPHQLRHTFITWRAQAGQQPHEIASVTHHDVTVALGALGGYMDMQAIGGKVRNSAPIWLGDLVGRLVAR